MDRRAYSILAIKAFDEATRTFSGTATTPTPDSVGDIVEPLGVEFTNPLPLLLHHDSERPVGNAMFHPPTKKGIDFTATIANIPEPGALKDRCDEAWQSVKAKLLRGASVRLRAHKDDVAYFANGGIHWIKSRVLELSLVTIPANADATIASVKSCDTGHAASGTETARTHAPGATGTTRVVKMRTETTAMKTIQEQIKGFEATRQAKTARMNEIMTVSAEKGETLDVKDTEEYDTLKGEITSIDQHLVRLKEHEKMNIGAATAVDATTAEKASASRGGQQVISVKQTLPPGIEFARYAMCLASAKGMTSQAYEIAKARYPDNQRIHEALKAAVAAGTTTDATWAGNLVQYRDFEGDFVEYLRPQTIIGKFGTNGIPALQKVPFNVRVAGQTTGGSGYWVGEGKPKPLTKFGFSTTTLGFAKVANIAVLTEEEVRFSSPSAEAKVRDALAGALIERLDIDFVDPTKAAVANVSPASITNGVAAIAPTGTTAAYFRADFKSLMAPFIAANVTPSSAVLIMSSTMALSLSLMMNTLGQAEFPDISMTGGKILGIPVIVSEYLTALGSPSTQMIIIVNANDIWLADDGQVVIDASREASVEMLDGSLVQDSTAGTGASLVSLWQSNLLGLKAERFINWKKRRSSAAQYISPAAYA